MYLILTIKSKVFNQCPTHYINKTGINKRGMLVMLQFKLKTLFKINDKNIKNLIISHN